MPPVGSNRPPGAASDARIFLLSPANLSGVRGRRILEGRGEAPFMDALRGGETVPLGDVYAFVSSLYYRGKRLYARTFGRRAAGGPSSLVVTPSRGLAPDGAPVGLHDLEELASSDVDPSNPTYAEPLEATARALDEELGGRGEIVLLGSIASGKYVEPLAEVFGSRLHFPEAFIGRGDMSRGGLLLRSVDAGRELDYVAALTARRRGSRPPKLDQTTRG